MNKVLVVAVHPDDETLGCGGTLLKHKDDGDEIHWLISTEIKESDGFNKDIVARRNSEIDKIVNFYNFDSVNRLDISTTKVDEISTSHLISQISSIVNRVKPNVVYLPFKGDVHSDHKHIFNAVYSCTKSFRYPFIKKIYMMEILSETEFSVSTKDDSFIPNSYVDIDHYIDKKIEIMNVYKSEISEPPFPRSEKNIRALSTFRGSTCGHEYAEAFVLLKEVK